MTEIEQPFFVQMALPVLVPGGGMALRSVIGRVFAIDHEAANLLVWPMGIGLRFDKAAWYPSAALKPLPAIEQCLMPPPPSWSLTYSKQPAT